MHYIEIMNEGLILVTVYFVILLTNFVTDVKARYYVGYGANLYIILIIIINIIFIADALYYRIRRAYRKWKFEKAWTQYYKEYELKKD